MRAGKLYVNCLLGNNGEGIIRRSLGLRLISNRIAYLLKLGNTNGSALLHALYNFRPPLKKRVHLVKGPLSNCSRTGFSLAINIMLARGAGTKKVAICRLISLNERPCANFFKRLGGQSRIVVRRSLRTTNVTRGTGGCISRLDSNRQRGTVVTGTLTRRYPVVLLSRPATFLSIADHVRAVILLRHLTIRRRGTILLSARSLSLTVRVKSYL